MWYDRGAVREYYVNGPLGLEQGFTLARSVPGSRDAPLTLSVAAGGNLRPMLESRRRAIRFVATGGRVVLRYRGLVATDARGRALPVWLSVSAGSVDIRVDDRHARYPLRIDPFIQQGANSSAPVLAGATVRGAA